MCKTFLPLMRDHGRIVNVSSVGSTANGFNNKEFAARFKNQDLTLAKLDSLMQEYEVRTIVHPTCSNSIPIARIQR